MNLDAVVQDRRQPLDEGEAKAEPRGSRAQTKAEGAKPVILVRKTLSSWSFGIPTPVSQTSTRRLSPRRRQPSKTRPPASLYLIAFDTRFPTSLSSRRGSLRTMAEEETERSFMLRSSRHATKLAAHPVEQPLDREDADLGFHPAGVEPIDIEQCAY